MSHAVIEGFGRRVPAQAQGLPAADPGQAPGADGQPEAQRPDAAQGVRGGPFPGPRLGESRRLDLETPHEVMGQEAELWLGAVGPGVIRGDHVQGTLALALAQGLLLGVPAGDEVPKPRPAERFVRGYGQALEVSLVGGKEVQVELLLALVVHALAGGHQTPWGFTLGAWLGARSGPFSGWSRGSMVTIPAKNQNGSMIRTMMKVLAPMAWTNRLTRPAR